MQNQCVFYTLCDTVNTLHCMITVADTPENNSEAGTLMLIKRICILMNFNVTISSSFYM
jgi:hypothetical protein